jgi:hypothetical protein
VDGRPDGIVTQLLQQVPPLSGSRTNLALVNSEPGAVIAAWEDTRAGLPNVYVQRATSGLRTWAFDGIQVSAGRGQNPRLASDGNGGAIVVWYQPIGGFGPELRAQRVALNGSPVWASPILVSDVSGAQVQHTVISDGRGGAIVVWEDDRSGHFDIYAQRIDAAGGAASVVAVAPTGVPGASPAIRIRPNPCLGSAVFSLQGSDARDVHFDVFDVRGRLVRSLAADRTSGAVRWDGRDGSGRVVSAGLYWVRANAEADLPSVRLVVLR